MKDVWIEWIETTRQTAVFEVADGWTMTNETVETLAANVDEMGTSKDYQVTDREILSVDVFTP